jgi:DNA-directed RNA polymerase subunit RPC12/RpoP
MKENEDAAAQPRRLFPAQRDRRTLMDALDGNAIGGLLIDVFGTDMTAARSTCATCGARRPVAELVVYRQAPGTVVRCRTCGSVLMVFVRAHGVIGTDLTGLASLSQPAHPLSLWLHRRARPRMPW